MAHQTLMIDTPVAHQTLMIDTRGGMQKAFGDGLRVPDERFLQEIGLKRRPFVKTPSFFAFSCREMSGCMTLM